MFGTLHHLLVLALAFAAAPQQAAAPAERPVPFRVGEKLTYDVSWANMLSAGTATFSVAGTRPSAGNRSAFDIVAEARPGYLLGTLYPIYYKMESYADTRTILPIQATMYSEERSRKRTKTTKFVSPTSIEYEFQAGSISRTARTVERLTYDPLSLFYAVRTMPLSPGQQVTFPITDGGRVYKISLKVGGYEQVSTGAGKFRALRLTPAIMDEQGKPVTDRKLSLWISDDVRHLPIRFESVLLVGSFVMNLSRVE